MSEFARVIFDEPATGSWNMAVDQALLMSAENDNRATLRFYGWAEPTLSLGYFQKYDSRQEHSASQACPLVRRRSGGGAIVHDKELTYSLALPSTNRWSSKNSELYDLVHELIVDLLLVAGVESSLFRDSGHSMVGKGDEAANEGALPEPVVSEHAFLCFQRRTPGDIVRSGFKIVGSAQRRLKHSLLQHGSILLSQSDRAPELPGIKQLGESLDPSALADQLIAGLRSKLRIEFQNAKLDSIEIEVAREIEESVFGQTKWNKKR